jgi:hypothetical protein
VVRNDEKDYRLNLRGQLMFFDIDWLYVLFNWLVLIAVPVAIIVLVVKGQSQAVFKGIAKKDVEKGEGE